MLDYVVPRDLKHFFIILPLFCVVPVALILTGSPESKLAATIFGIGGSLVYVALLYSYWKNRTYFKEDQDDRNRFAVHVVLALVCLLTTTTFVLALEGSQAELAGGEGGGISLQDAWRHADYGGIYLRNASVFMEDYGEVKRECRSSHLHKCNNRYDAYCAGVVWNKDELPPELQVVAVCKSSKCPCSEWGQPLSAGIVKHVSSNPFDAAIQDLALKVHLEPSPHMLVIVWKDPDDYWGVERTFWLWIVPVAGSALWWGVSMVVHALGFTMIGDRSRGESGFCGALWSSNKAMDDL